MRSSRIVLAMLVLLVAACARSSTTAAPAAVESGPPTPRPRPLPPPAKSSAEINPASQSGQQVFITAKGFRPQLLFAVIGEEIRFINETSAPATVKFTVLDFSAGPIKPGGWAAYTPRSAESIAYHFAGRPDVKAAIQVGPYFDPGEDPAADRRLDADTPGESRSDQVWR